MKNFIPKFGLWIFIAMLFSLEDCNSSRQNQSPEVTLSLKVDQIDLEELEVGNFLEEWNLSEPLEVGTLDLTKGGVIDSKDSLGIIWVKKITSKNRIEAGKAVNDTLIRNPLLKGLKVRTLLLKVLDPKSKSTVVRKFANVTIKEASIHRLVMSQMAESSSKELDYQKTLATAQKVQNKVKAAEKLRAAKAKESPLHAAKMLEPNLANLDSAVAAIILHLKQYKPNGGSVDLSAFNLEIESIDNQTVDIVNAMTNPASEVRELKIVFASASYEIDIDRNGAVLNDYLSGVLEDLSTARLNSTNKLTVKVVVAAFADLQNINDINLRNSLSERYNEVCDGSQECLNKLLSKARAEAVKDWFGQSISQKVGPETLVDVVIEAKGEGWEVPKTYQGNCPNKNCEDRRIALISRVVF